jgi:uncharacterized membrane protein YqjE
MVRDRPSNSDLHLADASGRVAHRLCVILENRLQLLLVEVQEERERILRAIWLALGAAVFGLLAGVALTVAIVLELWGRSPIVASLALTAIYASAAALFYAKLFRLQRDWQTLSDTIEQLKKDRECLEKRHI